MRYFLAAAAAVFVFGLPAKAALSDPNYLITSLRLVGLGTVTSSQYSMCSIGPCPTEPTTISPISFDFTYNFKPVSSTGYQRIDIYSSENFLDLGSIIDQITFVDGMFVNATGFRDSVSDVGCYYGTSEEDYSFNSFSAYTYFCIGSPNPDEPFGDGIRQVYSYVGVVTEVWVNDVRVPEPASWAMMITGFGMTGVTLRRRQRSISAA